MTSKGRYAAALSHSPSPPPRIGADRRSCRANSRRSCRFGGRNRHAYLFFYIPRRIRPVARSIVDRANRDVRMWPFAHFAPPYDCGRKRGVAEVEGQPSIAEGDAYDPNRTWRAHPDRSGHWSRQVDAFELKLHKLTKPVASTKANCKSSGNTHMQDLTGRTAFVTGAASGIGLGIATALSQAG